MADEAESGWSPRPYEYILLGGGMYILFMCFGRRKRDPELVPIAGEEEPGTSGMAPEYGAFEGPYHPPSEDKGTQTDPLSNAIMWQAVAVGEPAEDTVHRTELVLDFSTGSISRSESIKHNSVARRMISIED
uniref:Uncharacterized protein n=1 Tax=Ciona savignyi TaxID=51511 RepID=H2Z996_CIOSA